MNTDIRAIAQGVTLLSSCSGISENIILSQNIPRLISSYKTSSFYSFVYESMLHFSFRPERNLRVIIIQLSFVPLRGSCVRVETRDLQTETISEEESVKSRIVQHGFRAHIVSNQVLEKRPITRVIVDSEASILESIFGCDKCYKIYIRKNMYIHR